MLKKSEPSKPEPEETDADFFDRLWGKSWTLVKTVVDVVREPVLILDNTFRVIAANQPFYDTFRATPIDTLNTIVFDLGNGQWNIPPLRKLLEDILPKDTFFKGFQVAHEFPSIGRRVMVLNARQIHIKDEDHLLPNAPIIVLAMEDVTEMMLVAEELAEHAKKIESNLLGRIGRLEQEVQSLREE